jgi:hypothetical protein
MQSGITHLQGLSMSLTAGALHSVYNHDRDRQLLTLTIDGWCAQPVHFPCVTGTQLSKSTTRAKALVARSVVHERKLHLCIAAHLPSCCLTCMYMCCE